MGEGIELTKAEQTAKEHFLMIIREGSKCVCDDEQSITSFDMPSWYNEELYNRGRQFYRDNRAAILQSNFVGLICLLAEPRGLSILRSTERSNTPDTARKRYLSTITHVMSWYDYDFTPESKALESLKRVRKLHYLASKSADSRGLGRINQVELALTAFGFMGFALVRPEPLGVHYDNEDDRKGFVHFWAVICHMLGVHERFNICLLPVDALIVLCQMIIRYILLPLIQLEGPLFKEMVQAITVGLKPFLPEADYEVDIFVARRLLLVPGYQYKVDLEKEVHCRSLLTQADTDEINDHVKEYYKSSYPFPFTVDIPLIEVTTAHVNVICEESASTTNHSKNEIDEDVLQNLARAMGLATNERVTVRLINYETEWQSCLNDSKFYKLSAKRRFLLRFKYWFRLIYSNYFGRYLIEGAMNFLLAKITKASFYYNKNRQVQTA